ncbi:hypothetical protein QQS21_006668 [Conoideocrella luteorostrata]|uniref:Uncharacterized protein n=1 Tax=Conoideocrella luteorostrata TaxID=1105319 RepID=A0AAJ0CM66_9HYPO|nr:hypothetical protein QQS21_006668 [Conoideocrella luteorostrata]
MPSEAKQSKLAQPWKAWHADLNPMSREDIREGTFAWKAGDSDHGMVAVEPREDVDLTKPKGQSEQKYDTDIILKP